MKKLILALGIALAMSGAAEARGNGGLYKVAISSKADFTYARARMNAHQQFGVNLEEVLQEGGIVEVCKDTAKKNGNPWQTCLYLVPAPAAAKTYTVYDNHSNVNDPFWGTRHGMTLRQAHDKGLTYRVCPANFVANPAIKPVCQTW